jgi:integrase
VHPCSRMPDNAQWPGRRVKRRPPGPPGAGTRTTSLQTHFVVRPFRYCVEKLKHVFLFFPIRQAGIANLAPHDLVRTCARLCHGCGGELEQIQFLLGHASVQTTERYIGRKQNFQDAVNDRLGISVASDSA